MKDHKETKDTTKQHTIHNVTGPDLVLAGEVHRLIDIEKYLDQRLATTSGAEDAISDEARKVAIEYLDQLVDISREGIRELTSDWTPYPGRPIAKNPEQRAWAFAGHLDELRRDPHLYYNTTSAMLRLGPVLVDTELAITYQLMRTQYPDDMEMLLATQEQLLNRTRDTLKKWLDAQQAILEAHTPWLDSSAWTLELHLKAPSKSNEKGEMCWIAHPRVPTSAEDQQ